MWRAYALYRCPECGYSRRSSSKIYKYDEDAYHWQAFESSPQHIDAHEAVTGKCPRCGKAIMRHVGWIDDD